MNNSIDNDSSSHKRSPDGDLSLTGLTYIRIYIPGHNEYPLEKAERWAERYYQGLRHTSAQQRKAVPNQKAFFEKIAQPILDKFRYLTEPEFKDFVSRKGRDWEDIYARMKYRLLDPRTARKYLKYTKKAYQVKDGVKAKDIKDWLPYAAANYAMEMTFGAWRYLGPISDSGEGAFVLVSEWLTGKTDCLNFLRDKDQRLQGHSVLITAPERASEFRRALRNKLAHAVMIIDIYNYAQDEVKKQNDRINEFVNGFIRPEITPFSIDGDSSRNNRDSAHASHINFVVLPETAKLRQSQELRELRYRICRHFFDKPSLQNLLIAPEYMNRIIPSLVPTLIGNPDYPLCVDMYLDIKVILNKTS
ncbi:MAG: hypothetical protein V1871_08540 [Planctomycetota bacterium]